MSASYFIVLNSSDPGFDPFVNGKAIASEAKRLSKVAKSLGIKTPDGFVSASAEQMESLGEDFGVDDVPAGTEQWFDAGEGIELVSRIRTHLQTNPNAVKNLEGVMRDLAEYERVLSQAMAAGAKWHLSVDY